MTVSMLRGEDGFQSKEIVKLVEWLRGQPPFDLIVLPNSLLLGLAPPLARALGRPVCCTLQGEDLFLEGLPAEDRAESLRLIRSHRDSVARFIAVSDFYAEHMAGYLDLPRDADAHGAARHPRRGATLGRGREPAAAAVHRRLLRPHRAREGAAHAGGGVRADAPRRPAARRPAGGGGLHRPRAPRLPGEDPGRPGRGRAGRRVPLSRRAGPRGQDALPALAGRGVGAQPVRGAEGDVRAGGAGLRHARRAAAATARSRRSWAARAAASCSPPATWPRSRRRSSSSTTIRTAGRPWASRARVACGASTRSDGWRSGRSRSTTRRSASAAPAAARA